MPSQEQIETAMKVLHFERNPPSSGRYLPWREVSLLTLKALEVDARAALALAESGPGEIYPP